MRRWRTILLVGLIEAAAIVAIGSLWLAQAGGSLSLADLLAVWADQTAVAAIVVWAALILAGQGVILLPVRRPIHTIEGGVSVFFSLAAAGLCVSVMSSAVVYASLELFNKWDVFIDRPGTGWAMLGMLVGGWALATPMLLAFVRRGQRDTMVSRVGAGLFLGTAIETIAIIPIDVMVRRRTDCYCGAGTFLALTLTGSVGLVALGPAVFVPLLIRRRKRWRMSRCDHCGYDMTGNLDADRCPECGCGWRSKR